LTGSHCSEIICVIKGQNKTSKGGPYLVVSSGVTALQFM